MTFVVTTDPLTRLMAKVSKDPATNCWNFLSSIHPKGGQGRFFFEGRCRDAYVVAYKLLKGPVPPDTELHHECENRQCVNPAHLKPMSRRDHVTKYTPSHLTYKNAQKTACPYGHPLTPDNLVKGRSARVCLTCARRRSRECNQRKRDLLKGSA